MDKAYGGFNSVHNYISESGGGGVQLLFFAVLIGWPILSQQLNNFAAQAGGQAQSSGRQPQNVIPCGAEVVVDGLRQATEYNGQRGTVLAFIPGAGGQPSKYRVQLKTRSEEKVTISMSPAPLGMSFVNGGRITTVPAGCQAAILGVKPDWIVRSVAGKGVEGEPVQAVTAAFDAAMSKGESYPVVFATPKVLAIRTDNLVRASS